MWKEEGGLKIQACPFENAEARAREEKKKKPRVPTVPIVPMVPIGKIIFWPPSSLLQKKDPAFLG